MGTRSWQLDAGQRLMLTPPPPPFFPVPQVFRSGREPSMPLQIGPFEIVLTNRGNMENFIMPFIE